MYQLFRDHVDLTIYCEPARFDSILFLELVRKSTARIILYILDKEFDRLLMC